MIGVDTSVLLRLLLDDDAAQAARLEAWLGSLPAAAVQVHVADVVLAEASRTLASVYRQPKPELLKALRALLAEPMFTFEHRAAVAAAVDAFESAGCGFADCLIAAKNQAMRCSGTVSFDQRLGRLAGVSLL